MRSRAVIACLALVASACGPSVDRPDVGPFGHIDASTGPSGPPPATPRLDELPDAIPYSVITLRGEASDAQRVIVRGTNDYGDINPVQTTVNPADGSFCVDISAFDTGTYSFDVYAQSNEGILSEMAAMGRIDVDPSAHPVPGFVTCSGSDPGSCPNDTEICDNNRDDDCNGLVDGDDPACSMCDNDAFDSASNNDTAGSATRLDPNQFNVDDLAICPGDVDNYLVHAQSGDLIEVHIYFNNAGGDLALELQDTMRGEVVASSDTPTDDETLSYDATRDGDYIVRVYGADSDAQNTYSLDISVGGT